MTSMQRLAEVVKLVVEECDRQDDKFPNQSMNSRMHWVSILAEEMLETLQAANDGETGGWLPEHVDHFRVETVQVAAVAMRILEFT